MKLYKQNNFIENKKENDIDNLLFENNPNFRYKENIVNDFDYSYWICDTFDIYHPLKEDKKELYLVYSVFDIKIEINIIRISDKKKIKSLSGHSNHIDKVKNFYNEKDKHNYLLSSDWNYTLFIWDLDNNYQIINKIITGYTNYLYSFLLYFKLNYVITSTVGNSEQIDYIKIYSFKDGNLIRNIPNTDNNDTLYCLIWEKGQNEIYLVACCYEKISIFNLLNNDLYGHLVTENKYSCGDFYLSGFISYDNKYLYTSSKNGYINIWDLNQKLLIQSILIPNSSLFKIIPWSTYVNYSIDKDDLKTYKNINNYILVCNKEKCAILYLNITFRNEIDFNEFTNKISNLEEEVFYKSQIINFIKNIKNSPIKMIKKIKHPLYGDSILCSDENYNIDLWVKNQPIMIDIFENNK